MNVYRVIIKGTPKHGEPYEDEHELIGDTVGAIRRQVKATLLRKHEVIKTIELLREIQ